MANYFILCVHQIILPSGEKDESVFMIISSFRFCFRHTDLDRLKHTSSLMGYNKKSILPKRKKKGNEAKVLD